VVKNLGTCKIHKYNVGRMTQGEYNRFAARKYTAFLEAVKTKLEDFPNQKFLFFAVRRAIRRSDDYYSRHY